MATPAAVLSVLVEANTAQAAVKLTEFEGQLEKAGLKTTELEAKSAGLGRGLRILSGETEKSRSSLVGLAKGALAAGAVFAGFELAKDAVKNTVDLGTATLRLTAITGADTKTASTWIEVMKARGLSSESAAMAFITLERNIRNAAAGSKTATTAFHELGISQDELAHTDPTQMIGLIADGLSKLKSPAERAAIAQQLFSRGAKALIPILSQGSKGIEENLHAAQQYGAYLPNNTKQIQAAVEASHKLEFAQQGLQIAFTQAVLPSLVKVGQGVLTFISQMRSGTGAGGQFASAIKSAFGVVKDVIGGVVSTFGGLGNTIKIALAAFAAYKVAAFTAKLIELFAVIRASPVGLMLTGVGLLATALFGVTGAEDAAAGSAEGLSSAWHDATHAAHDLADAHLNLLQARLNVRRSAIDEVTAQRAVNAALRQYGQNSIQYRMAVVNAKNAQLAHKQAIQDVKDAMQQQGDAQTSLTSKYKQAIAAAKSNVAVDKDYLRTAIASHAPMADIRDLTAQLAQDTRKLHDVQVAARNSTGALKSGTDMLTGSTNRATGSVDRLVGSLNRLPAHKRVGVEVDVSLRGFLPAVRMLFPGWHGGSLSQTPPPGLARTYSGSGYTPPGQTTAAQIHSQTLANAGSTAAQIAFDRRLLAQDRAMLSRTRGQARLNLLQDIGSLQGNIKSLQSSTAATNTSTSATSRSTAATNSATAASNARAAAERAAAAALARWTAYWARIPSQGVRQQIKMDLIQNRLGLATNAFGGAGNIVAETKDTKAEIKLEKQWLSADEQKLRRINKQLAKRGLSRKQRWALLQDKHALLQEIGSIQSNIGQQQQSLASLASGDTGSGTTAGTGQFDLTPTGGQVTLPTFLDVTKSVQHAGGRHVHHHHGNVTVHVHNPGDVHRVADAIDRVSGGHLHAKLRAAGLRGT